MSGAAAGGAAGASSGIASAGMGASAGAAPASIAAIPVNSSTMSNGEFNQWYGVSRDQLNGIGGMGKGIADAGQQYAKRYNTQAPPAMGWNQNPNQGYPFMQDLYTIKH